jgi:small ligand-binding sensory domain FIST
VLVTSRNHGASAELASNALWAEVQPEHAIGCVAETVVGGDRGWMGDRIEVAETIQFHIRDAVTADEDLRTLLEREAEPAAGALLFTCNGRGSRLFSVPNHDASLVSKMLGGLPLAGFNCAGEIGPIGGKNFLHGFTASVALLVDA